MNKRKHVDLVNGPVDEAVRRVQEQLDRFIADMQPQTGARPMLRWLHEQGILLKDLQDGG